MLEIDFTIAVTSPPLDRSIVFTLFYYGYFFVCLLYSENFIIFDNILKCVLTELIGKLS